MSKIQTTTLQSKPLERVARFIRGITFTPDDKVDPGTEGSAVCMRTANVQDILDESDLIAIPLEFVKREEQFLLESDILVSTANSWNLVGKCSWVPKLSYRATAGGFISILRADRSKVFPRYLYYWFASDKTQHDVRLCGRQTTNISNMSYERCLALAIPLPPLTEQKRIADILDKADSIRRKRQQSIKVAYDFLTSLFVKTFGSPQHNPHGYPIHPFGNVVENCDSRRVPLKQSDRDKRDGVYPYYGAVGIIDFLDDFLFDGDYLLISEDGKHLESRNRPIACLATGKFWVNNHAHVLAANGTVLLPYLARYMELKHIREFVTGIDQFKLNRSSLDRIPVAVPPMDTQLAFVAIEKHVLQIIAKSELAMANAETMFNSLRQRAFKGEL
jgi:type I restriction enzyme S subunit